MVRFFQAEILRFFSQFSLRVRNMLYEGAMFWLANTTLSDRCEPPLPCFSGENPACVLCVCACVCVTVWCFFVKGDFLKIRTQFAVEMLLCIIYFFFPPFRPLLRRCFGWKLLQ